MLLTILIGFLGLDIVVLVHELGHLFAAKLMGINVETFSIGMGKKLYSIYFGETEYCISIFPIGGYCKMKGEKQFNKAIREKASSIVYEKGSIFSATPIKRILTYFAGPLFNIIFSVIVLSIIWSAGFSFNTYSNKVILLSDYPEIFESHNNPADESGLMTGDKIISIDNITIQNYSNLQDIIYGSAGKELSIVVDRNSNERTLSITPVLNKETGAGRIGVSPWVDAEVKSVVPGSSADIGGLKTGDIIKAVNNIQVDNHLDIYMAMTARPEYLILSIQSESGNREISLVPIYMDEGKTDLGIIYKTLSIEQEKLNILSAIRKGSIETYNTFAMTVKSIYLLFAGVDVKKAVSGPIRISYYVGEVASNSFKEGIKTGFTTIFRFLSMISVALGFANLLPIPIFDGGLILFTSIELIRGKPLKPSIFYRYQSFGFFLILIIFFMTTYSDISFLFSK
ncbi:MAG: site-2 protease family protein [Spirochaetia bacterium]|jgi:regulator of sigma E protease|nr:site-2 protease family protein [Spirochaetia bacterium]